MKEADQHDPEFSIKKGRVIGLTEADVMAIYSMAAAKISAKEEFNLPDTTYGFSGNALEKEKHAVGAEFAFCRAINIGDIDEMDAVNNRKYDFKICNKTIDIKATGFQNGRLFVRPEKQYYCDWFLLFYRVDLRNFKFIGAAEKHELICRENLSCPDGFRAPVYWMAQKDLKDFTL